MLVPRRIRIGTIVVAALCALAAITVIASVVLRDAHKAPAADTSRKPTTDQIDIQQGVHSAGHARINPIAGEANVTELTFDDDPIATSLLAEIRSNTSNVQARRTLARHYSNSFPTAGAFYDSTADLIEGRPFPPAPWPEGRGFRCEAQTGPESHDAYLALADRFASVDPSKMSDYIAAIGDAMRRQGQSCDLMLLWATAVVRKNEWRPVAIDEATQEKAVRILFDVAETYVPLHEAEPAPQLFLDLAGYFELVRHDYVSAYVAALWAEQRLRIAEVRPELREKYQARIARYLATYEPHLPKTAHGK
jgi:hypothetical protein